MNDFTSQKNRVSILGETALTLNLKALQDQEIYVDDELTRDSSSSLGLTRESSIVKESSIVRDSSIVRESSINASQPIFSVETEIKSINFQFSKKILDVIGYLTFKLK